MQKKITCCIFISISTFLSIACVEKNAFTTLRKTQWWLYKCDGRFEKKKRKSWKIFFCLTVCKEFLFISVCASAWSDDARFEQVWFEQERFARFSKSDDDDFFEHSNLVLWISYECLKKTIIQIDISWA